MPTTSATEKVVRERSPSFPFIPLETAINRLVEFDTKFPRQEPPADRVYLAWGMKGDTSQAQQTLGALRAFGLVEYKGSGAKRPVAVSHDGRNYLRAQQDSVRHNLLKVLALKPKWIAHFWRQWGSKKVPDPVRLDTLVLENRFNESAAPVFLRVYDSTIAFAGLSEDDEYEVGEIGSTDFGSDLGDAASTIQAEVGDLVQVEIGGSLALPAPVRVRAIQVHEGQSWAFLEGSETGVPLSQIRLQQKRSPVNTAPVLALPARDDTTKSSPTASPSVRAGWREERLIDDEGDETFISYQGEPSIERYEFIRDYLEFRIKRLKPSATKSGE